MFIYKVCKSILRNSKDLDAAVQTLIIYYLLCLKNSYMKQCLETRIPGKIQLTTP